MTPEQKFLEKIEKHREKMSFIRKELKTEEDFLNYISQNQYELEEIYEEIDEQTQSELDKIWSPEWTEFSNSAWKYEDSWHESGRVDETWTKYGGFEATHTTDTGY